MNLWIFPLFRQTYVITKNIIILHILCFLNIMLPYCSIVNYSMYVKECLRKVQSCGTREIPHMWMSTSTNAYMTLFKQKPVVN